jgi:gp16 family phage-associated protein
MHIKTGEQVKQEYKAQGIPLSSVAKQQGWRSQDVYKVLNGQYKGNFGLAHDIAVFFGMKPNPKHSNQ